MGGISVQLLALATQQGLWNRLLMHTDAETCFRLLVGAGRQEGGKNTSPAGTNTGIDKNYSQKRGYLREQMRVPRVSPATAVITVVCRVWRGLNH